MQTVVQSAVRKRTGGESIAQSSHHVVHNSNGEWDVNRSGTQRSSAHFTTNEQEESAGRLISRHHGTEFFVHGMNGRIQSANSHGGDNHSPKF